MRLSPRDRRALWLGAIAAAAVLGYALVIRPLVSTAGELRERRHLLAETAARYRSVLTVQGAYETAADTLRLHLARLARRTFPEGGPEEAAGALLSLLNEHAAANLVRVLQAVPLPPDSVAGDVLAVGAKLELESDLAGVLGLLRSLETEERIVHVSELQVSAPASGSSGEGVQVLRFAFTTRGYFLASQPEDSDAARTAP